MTRLVRRRGRAVALALSCSLLTLGTASVLAPSAGAVSPVSSAITWLRTQQQADGGFELSGFANFETSDAVFALAEAAQTSGSWNAAEARAAVLATQTGSHLTPLHYLDDYADGASGAIGAGQAAKLILLVTNPLGLDPNTFDPDCDGVVDLAAKIGAPGVDGKYGISIFAFNSILFAAQATKALGGTVASATVQVIRDAQRSSGGFSYNGQPTDDPLDGFDDPSIDTTAYAVLALLDAGIDPGTDATLIAALNWLESQRNTGSGAWQAFGFDDINATALAMYSLSVAGRSTYLAAGQAWLESQQEIDGEFPSFGNTFGTTQAVQALVRKLPSSVGTGGVASCTDGNRDGVDDSGQANVKTVPALSGTAQVTVASTAGTLSGVGVSDPTSQPTPPTGLTLPDGLIGFTISGLSSGSTVTVTIYLHSASTATGYSKLRNGVWTDFSAHASFADAPGGGRMVTLTLTDGGAGDADGVANGTIVDPGAPTVGTAQVDPGSTLVVRFAG